MMKRWRWRAVAALVLLAGLLCLGPQMTLRAADAEPAEQFATLDVYLDSAGRELGAYQVVITGRDAQLVGLSGGEDHAAFADPPFYDPRALHAAPPRIIIAAFSTATELPTHKVRVARLHVQYTGTQLPHFSPQVMVAGDRNARPLRQVNVSLQITPSARSR